MPFATLEDLPDNIKKLSTAKQEQWRGTWNARFEDCRKDGGTERTCESSAFAVANDAVTKDLDPEERAKFYNGMIEQFDIYGAQFPQEDVDYSSLGATDERGCANCRWFIAPGACIIVSSYPDPITPNGLSNRWEVKTPYVQEPLKVVIVGEEKDLPAEDLQDGAKATKKEGGVDYPPGDFAVVPDSDKPGGWKLRLAEGSAGNLTVVQVGRAITALQPSGFRGRKVQLTAEQKSGALRKIGGAIGRISGATAEQKTALRERLDKVKTLTVEVRIPQRMLATVKAALQSVLGPDDPDGAFTLYKDLNGDMRWFMRVSNHWRDRDYPPEILSGKAHRAFEEYVDRTGDFPDAWLWHTPGSKWGTADFVTYDDGFLLVSGTVDPGMEHVADWLATQKGLGVSHGFNYLHSDPDEGIIGWYRTFEVSPLPAEAAANPWTSVEVIQKDMEGPMNSKKREFLVQALGEDAVARISDDTAAMKAALEAKGVEWKDVPEDDVVIVNNPPLDMKALALESGKAAAEALVATPAFKGMVEAQEAQGVQLTALAAKVILLEKSDDEKVAALVGARDLRARGYRASADDKNVLDPESKEAKDAKDKDGGPTDWFGGVIEAVGAPTVP